MDLIGRKVEVYRNLRCGTWSVRERGKVIARQSRIVLSDVSFVVRRGGRARALREQQRNVHAFVRGTLTSVEPLRGEHAFVRGTVAAQAHGGLQVEVNYYPWKCGSFVTCEGGRPVRGAELVIMEYPKVYAIGLEYGDIKE